MQPSPIASPNTDHHPPLGPGGGCALIGLGADAGHITLATDCIITRRSFHVGVSGKRVWASTHHSPAHPPFWQRHQEGGFRRRGATVDARSPARDYIGHLDGLTTPNEPQFANQWHLSRISAPGGLEHVAEVFLDL